jgi:hypothetical protein
MAHIRQKFKDGNLDGYQKKKYLAKVVFTYILGYKVDVGHMEAVNLISSQKYSEKQIVSPAASASTWGEVGRPRRRSDLVMPMPTPTLTQIGLLGFDSLDARELGHGEIGHQLAEKRPGRLQRDQQLSGATCYSDTRRKGDGRDVE